MAYYSIQGLNLEILFNKVPIDPIYNYKKAYNKYYKEYFYRNKNKS